MFFPTYPPLRTSPGVTVDVYVHHVTTPSPRLNCLTQPGSPVHGKRFCVVPLPITLAQKKESNSYLYNYIYIVSIVFSAVATVDLVIGIIDISFALMAIPNMITLIWLSKKVNSLLFPKFESKKANA